MFGWPLLIRLLRFTRRRLHSLIHYARRVGLGRSAEFPYLRLHASVLQPACLPLMTTMHRMVFVHSGDAVCEVPTSQLMPSFVP